MAKKKQEVEGRMSMEDMRNIINKNAGYDIAFNLEGENPTEVKQWIPTGSKWLDGIIARGKWAGIPVGKIVELAGTESSGKSYMAAQIAANAQKLGIDVVYFDSESAIDPKFLSNAGCDLKKLLYIQAQSVEFVLETIETLLSSGNQMLFIWDSLALTPSNSDIEGDYNPNSSVAVKPRVLAKGLSKLVIPIANQNATLLVLNQLKVNIPPRHAMHEALTKPFKTPGGMALTYAYSLRIWLTDRKGKASFLLDDKGYRVGTELKVKIEKSRFGTQGRQCTFKIIWGDASNVSICDKESWFEAIKSSEHVKTGAWNKLFYKDGTNKSFTSSNWLEELKDKKFRKRVAELMQEEVVMKFDKRTGSAQSFYDIDEEETSKNGKSKKRKTANKQ